jgi:hypothetical protein
LDYKLAFVCHVVNYVYKHYREKMLFQCHWMSEGLGGAQTLFPIRAARNCTHLEILLTNKLAKNILSVPTGVWPPAFPPGC